jgi:hypothetical protein
MPDQVPLPPAEPIKAKAERKVSIKLLNDVWIENPDTHEIERVRTNIQVLDENGNPAVDKKTKAPITTQVVVEIPVSVAKMLIDQGKAERMDPL